MKKEQEKKIKMGAKQWQAIFDSITDLVLVHDRDCRITRVNKAFATAFRMKPKDFIGKKCYEVFPGLEEPSLLCPHKKLLKTKKPTTLEVFDSCLRTHFEISISPVLNEKGKASSYIHIAKDLTERKKAEEEIKTAYDRLQETQEELIQAEKSDAIVQLAGGVAHEVKNPLAVIMQAAEYLEENVTSHKKDVKSSINIIIDSIKRADTIIRSLANFVRITELNVKPQDINPILIRSLTLIKHRTKLESVKIIKKLQKNLPKVLVDSAKMEQVFVNIFLNSIQAMPDGGEIFIHGYPAKLKELKGKVGRRASDYFRLGEKAAVIEIEDTGVGIPKKNRRKLFSPFFTTKGPRGGAGLGLSVTKNIVDMQRGMIEIQSEEGKGTKVIITLKVHGGK